MSKLPTRQAKHTHNAITVRDAGALPVVAPAEPARPRFMFSYSFTEVLAVGRDASVRHSETRFDNGELTSKSFEASFDRSLYDQMLQQASDAALRQAATLMKSVLWFLPSRGDDDRARDR